MSLARAVVAGQTYMITRRCSERRFFLRPDAMTNNAFVYCLGIAANAYGIKVIFTVAMSNHHHTGLVDVLGTLPEFLAHFHKLLAKHQNALRGRWEAFWAPEQTSVVQLVDAEDMLNKMVYALTNPAKDHMVTEARDWPGVNSLTATLAGEKLRATRPTVFFRADGEMPKDVELELHRPEALVQAYPSDFIEVLKERVAAVESQAAAERAQTGRLVLGRAMALAQAWSDSPQSREARRQLNPRVACSNVWRRIEMLNRNRKWLAEYKAARELFVAGVKEVCFPHGTFWLCRFAGAPCEPAPAA